MSSYIVDDLTINTILNHLNRTAHHGNYNAAYALREAGYELREAGYELDQTDDLERLGADMFALNVNATSQRYQGESIETLPGTVGHYEYTFHFERDLGPSKALDALKTWLYQCSEGDVPETSELYRVFNHNVRISVMQELIDRYVPDAAA